jgi:hypothetical protein
MIKQTSVIKIIKREFMTIGQGDAGRYEYEDIQGVVESGDKVHRVTVESITGREFLHFKHEKNANEFTGK